jgi:hypothetical protein
MFKKKKIVLVVVSLFILSLITGCTESDVVSTNLSEDADNFKVLRKITFMNTITDEVLYTVEGNFSINADIDDNQLEITAKTGKNEYQKHFLGLSPTTVYVVEQLEWQETNKYNFKITVKPSTLIPDVNVQ